jgi:hypothetical protein
MIPSRNKYLNAINEFGQRDVAFVFKDMDRVEIFVGPVLEFEAQKVAVVGERATTQLDDESRREVGCSALLKNRKYKRIFRHTHRYRKLKDHSLSSLSARREK